MPGGMACPSRHRRDPLALDDAVQLQRWPAGAFHAAFPVAHQLGAHIEVMRQHGLAHAPALAQVARGDVMTLEEHEARIDKQLSSLR